MANSKGETSGKAPHCFKWDEVDEFQEDGIGRRLALEVVYDTSTHFARLRPADPGDIVAALLANPEARMAVLAHFWSPEECASVEKRAAELWQAIGEPELRRKLAEAEARLPHFEEAAELVRQAALEKALNPESGAKGEGGGEGTTAKGVDKGSV